MNLVLERPKDVDLKDLFGLRLRVRPGLHEQPSPHLDWREIEVGTQHVRWKTDAAVEFFNGILIDWKKQGKPLEWVQFTRGLLDLRRGDELLITITWNAD